MVTQRSSHFAVSTTTRAGYERPHADCRRAGASPARPVRWRRRRGCAGRHRRGRAVQRRVRGAARVRRPCRRACGSRPGSAPPSRCTPTGCGKLADAARVTAPATSPAPTRGGLEFGRRPMSALEHLPGPVVAARTRSTGRPQAVGRGRPTPSTARRGSVGRALENALAGAAGLLGVCGHRAGGRGGEDRRPARRRPRPRADRAAQRRHRHRGGPDPAAGHDRRRRGRGLHGRRRRQRDGARPCRR